MNLNKRIYVFLLCWLQRCELEEKRFKFKEMEEDKFCVTNLRKIRYVRIQIIFLLSQRHVAQRVALSFDTILKNSKDDHFINNLW